jgi:negative regulator of sigma E activity
MSEQTPPDDRPTGPVSGAHPDVDELSAYADGELDTARAREVGAHVDTCAGCVDDLRALQLVASELAALPAATMPADAAARLDEALAQERRAQPAHTQPAHTQPTQGGDVLPARRRTGPGWATGAAAAVAVGLLAVVGIGALSKVGGGADSKSAPAAAPQAVTDNAAESATTAVYHSGTNYSSSDFDRQLTAVIKSPADVQVDQADGYARLRQGSPPKRAAATASPYSAASGTSGESLNTSSLQSIASDPDRLRACVQALDPSLAPVAIDFATFEGKPVIVVVFPPGPDVPGQLQVYIADPECGVGGVDHTRQTRFVIPR